MCVYMYICSISICMNVCLYVYSHEPMYVYSHEPMWIYTDLIAYGTRPIQIARNKPTTHRTHRKCIIAYGTRPIQSVL